MTGLQKGLLNLISHKVISDSEESQPYVCDYDNEAFNVTVGVGRYSHF